MNPSRWFSGDGSLLPHEQILNAAEAAMTILGLGHMKLGDLGLTRLDIAKDFEGVRHGPLLIESILRRPHDGRWSVSAHALPDGTLGGLKAGGKRNFVRVYDKHAQSGGAVPPGCFRFEVRARREWLKRVGIRDLSDATIERVDALGRWAFERSHLGEPVVGWDVVVHRVLHEMSWSEVKAQRFLGTLLAIRCGHAPKFSNDRRASFRRQMDDVGVGVAGGWPSDEGRSIVRLDYATATEIVAEPLRR